MKLHVLKCHLRKRLTLELNSNSSLSIFDLELLEIQIAVSSTNQFTLGKPSILRLLDYKT
ncbi:hypothetical protein EGH82_22680 [Vibrio ponticus]|uniref:Uncharacterized protein n=1 Tax=Vibrio ponticus TaxID=265668 RepID=A0A3N3DT52_9VIBR|nr:hypothetical protein EGH82_22680 [Vibrio ponticus]